MFAKNQMSFLHYDCYLKLIRFLRKENTSIPIKHLRENDFTQQLFQN